MLILFLTLLIARHSYASIKDVDFGNFQYSSVAGLRSVRLRNGDYCSPGDKATCITSGSAVFGDITGDGEPEAAITLGAVFRFGNGSSSEGLVYTLKDGEPVLIGRFAGGDRRDGGIFDVKIVKQRLIVTRGHGCPICMDETEKDTFRWNGRRLVLESSSVQSADE